MHFLRYLLIYLTSWTPLAIWDVSIAIAIKILKTIIIVRRRMVIMIMIMNIIITPAKP